MIPAENERLPERRAFSFSSAGPPPPSKDQPMTLVFLYCQEYLRGGVTDVLIDGFSVAN